MRLVFLPLIVLLHYCAAGIEPRDKGQNKPEDKIEWAISSKCKEMRTESEYKALESSIGQGIETAEKALPVLQDFLKNINDQKYKHLKEISKGFFSGSSDDKELRKNLGMIKLTLENITAFPKTPTFTTVKQKKNIIQVSVDPLSREWVTRNSNLHVGFYCDTERFSPLPDKGSEEVSNAAWNGRIFRGLSKVNRLHNVCYIGLEQAEKLKNDKSLPDPIKASCKTSDVLNKGKDPVRHTAMNGQSMINICTWAVEEASTKWKWMSFDQLVDFVQTEEFEEDAAEKRVKPVWAFEHSFSKTMLHELMHTHQGGRLGDLPDKRYCYGWLGCQLAKTPNNADTAALMALLFRLHTKGFYWDQEGNMKKIGQ